MPKIPRNVYGKNLCKTLKKYGYVQTRQTGSHIRLTKSSKPEHHITIPNHKPIKVGTLNKILSDISNHLNISKDELISNL